MTAARHELAQFREQVTAWLEIAMPQLRQQFDDNRFFTLECRRVWEQMLKGAGWLALTWPAEFGGRALGTGELIIFYEECARRGAPQPINSIAHAILAPTLLRFGSQAQKERFLPGIRNSSEIWCQGYSEPGAGSDLASLQTRAELDGDTLVVNGQKIWTTNAHLAKWCFALVRSEKGTCGHHGLSFVLIDMQASGVRVAPIRQLTGEADYNEVFFDNVRVPVEQIVGSPGGGWQIAMAAAEFERGVYFLPRAIRLQRELDLATSLLSAAQVPASTRCRLQQQLAEAQDLGHVIQLRVAELTTQIEQGRSPGINGSIIKLLWSETRQRVMEICMELLGDAASLGPMAQGFRGETAIVREFLWSRAETIVAGTSEVQRNIVAERILGLPKDRHAPSK
jgi:alkylation response protein AidB-like acyl-CoA dehydrogenase